MNEQGSGPKPAGEMTVAQNADTDAAPADKPISDTSSPSLDFGVLFNMSPQPTWVYDRETLRFLLVNEAAVQHYGYSREEFLAMTVADIRPAENMARLHELLQVSPAGTTFHNDVRHRTRNGETINVSVHSNAIMYGDRAASIVVVNDVTARRAAEDALRESEERFRALAENATDIVTIFADDATILYQSPSLYTILGYRPEDRIGRSAFAEVHPDDLPAVKAAVAALSRENDAPLDAEPGEDGEPPNTPEKRRNIQQVVFRFRHADGTWRHLETVGSDERSNPAVRGFVVHSRDVTERIRLQSQVIQREKLAALGEMIAGVAHEINNPLAAISGHAQLLRLSSDPRVKDDARAIEAMVTRATRILRSLKNFARPSEEGYAIHNLTDAIESALDVVGHRLRAAGIDLRLRLADDLPLVLINRGEIEQVIVNLLTNAEQALRLMPPDERRITLRTRYAVAPPGVGREAVVLTVLDSGCGMPESVSSRIFDPFFTTRETGEGTGLGLYICYGIITAHGGTIEVDSREGEGASFTVTLPAAAAGGPPRASGV